MIAFATDLRTVALAIFVLVIAALVIFVIVERRIHGNRAYRARVDAIIDAALPRADAPAKWAATREEQKQ